MGPTALGCDEGSVSSYLKVGFVWGCLRCFTGFMIPRLHLFF